MPRICVTCTHPDREAIDRALAVGAASKRAIAIKYGLVWASLQRHESKHLDPLLIEAHKRALEAGAMSARQVIYEVVEDLRADAKACRDSRRSDQYLQVADRLIRANEQYGRVTKEIGDEKITAFLIPNGIRNEGEAKSAFHLWRNAQSITLEEVAGDAVEALRMVRAQRPDLFTAALENLRAASGAEVVAYTGNGHPNGAPPHGP